MTTSLYFHSLCLRHALHTIHDEFQVLSDFSPKEILLRIFLIRILMLKLENSWPYDAPPLQLEVF